MNQLIIIVITLSGNAAVMLMGKYIDGKMESRRLLRMKDMNIDSDPNVASSPAQEETHFWLILKRIFNVSGWGWVLSGPGLIVVLTLRPADSWPWWRVFSVGFLSVIFIASISAYVSAIVFKLLHYADILDRYRRLEKELRQREKEEFERLRRRVAELEGRSSSG